jgi:hypothetical protein
MIEKLNGAFQNHFQDLFKMTLLEVLAAKRVGPWSNCGGPAPQAKIAAVPGNIPGGRNGHNKRRPNHQNHPHAIPNMNTSAPPEVKCSRVRASLAASVLAAILVATGCQSARQNSAGHPGMYPPARTEASQAAMSPQEALAELRAGNSRFVAANSQVRGLQAKVSATASGQYPFAVILSCLDSRQPIEIVFDQSIGDVFSARVAGNVLNDDIVGSMEFACAAAGAKLIAVIGHRRCPVGQPHWSARENQTGDRQGARR